MRQLNAEVLVGLAAEEHEAIQTQDIYIYIYRYIKKYMHIFK
jgi:hypothetical protein